MLPDSFNVPKAPALPFFVTDRSSFMNHALLAVERTFGGYRCLSLFIQDPSVGVVHHIVLDHLIGNRYQIEPNRAGGVAPFIKQLKQRADEWGASPEAVMLLSRHVNFTKKEYQEMAEKLTRKAAADKKPAAKPAAAKKPAAKGGNPEALKKAREARTANANANDARKLTILNKENPYREGTNRAAAFDMLKGSKTVQDYKDKGGPGKYISRWEAEGYIALK